jgi:hypothetical protein
LEIHEIRTCAIGIDHIISSVCINAPPVGEYSMLHQKKIFGDYKLTAEAFLESAKLATLLHLQKIGVIYVDDINIGEVAKCEAKLAACQRELVTATACATMFQEEAVCMKAQLDSICTKDEKLFATTKESSVKKEDFIPQQANIKKEVSDAQSSTPPPSNRHINTRASTMKRKAPRMQLTM